MRINHVQQSETDKIRAKNKRRLPQRKPSLYVVI